MKSQQSLEIKKQDESKQTYSADDLQTLIKLQGLAKLKISRTRTKRRTQLDLGTTQSIDIDQQSRKNLFAIEKRLQQNSVLLPPAEQKAISADKQNPTDVLTQREAKLFQVLRNKNNLIHHTTSATVLQTILDGNKTLQDPQEVSRQGGATLKTATPGYGGIDQNVFFGFGSTNSSLPLFVRRRANPITGTIENYSTVKVDLKKLMHENPLIQKGIWCSGHFFHYQVASKKAKMRPLILGTTQFHWSYDVEFPMDPELERPVKYLNFIRQDGFEIKQLLGIGDEIASGKDLLPFFAYSFIERLRFVGGETREYLLDHPDNIELIDILTEKLFRVNDFEVHIPTQLNLNHDYINVITHEKRKEITTKVCTAAANGDVAQLIELKNQSYPLDGYMYTDVYYFQPDSAVSLPIVAAIKARKKAAVIWLIQNGANRSIFKSGQNKQYNSLEESDSEAIQQSIKIFNAAIHSKDVEYLDIVLANGLDINSYWDNKLCKEFKESPVYLEFYEDEYVDSFFLNTLKVVAKTHNLDLLDRVMSQSSYCNNPDVIKKRLLADIVMYGDKTILKHVIKKYNLDNNEIHYTELLKLAIMYGANPNILPYLNQFAYMEDVLKLQFVSLNQLIINCNIMKGHITTAEWVMKQCNIKPTDLPHEWLYGQIYTIPRDAIDKVAKWLIQTAKLDPNGRTNGPTLLSHAVRHNQIQTVCWLIEEADVKMTPEEKLEIPLSTNKAENEITRFFDILLSAWNKEMTDGFGISVNKNRHNPIYLAIVNGYLDLADYLLTLPNAALPSNLQDILLDAIKCHSIPIIQWLIKKRVDIYKPVVMFTAITTSTLEIVELLSKEGAWLPDYSFENDYDANQRQWVIVKKRNNLNPEQWQEQFIELISKMNDTAKFSDTVIKKAILIYKTQNDLLSEPMLFEETLRNENSAMLSWLEAKYRFTPELYTDLLVSIGKNPKDFKNPVLAAKWLLDHDVNPTLEDSAGMSFAESIMSQDYFNQTSLELMLLLSNRKVNLDALMKKYGPTIIVSSLITYALSDGVVGSGLIKWILSHKIDLNVHAEFKPVFSSTKNRLTPLTAACSENLIHLVKALVRVGADPNFFDEHSPLCAACLNNYDDIARYLLTIGAEVNLGGLSPLAAVCMYEKPNKALLNDLLTAGADPNYGLTMLPLIAASLTGDVELVNILLTAGADPNQWGRVGDCSFTPLSAILSEEKQDDSAGFKIKFSEDVLKRLLATGANYYHLFPKSELTIIEWVEKNKPNLLPIFNLYRKEDKPIVDKPLSPTIVTSSHALFDKSAVKASRVPKQQENKCLKVKLCNIV